MRYFATRLLGGLLIAFLLAPGMALAQTAKISGEVVDAETGEPLPGANVRLEGTTKGAATNANGEYTIFQVQPGTYAVSVSFVGYQNVRRTNVEVVSGITKRLDFELQEAEFEGEEVVVRAEEELVNQTATNAVRRLGREELQSLPTRNPETYYAIQPGVTLQDGEIHVRGGRSNETDYLLEGVSSRSALGTDNVVPVIPEALQETQVFMGGYEASRGGANGGIVQQQLRTGGETISASAQYQGDFAGDSFNDTYSYGYQDAVVTVGGPLYWDQHRFFVAANYRETDDYDPRFWEAAALNEATNGGLCGDLSAEGCHPPVDNVTTSQPDTADKSLAWGEGVAPGLGRPEEELRINGTLQFDFSPLQLRVAFAQVNRERRTNDLPITNFFNQRRVGEREDVRRLVSVQPTFFINDNTYIEAEAGYFQYDFEIYDPLIGKPGDGNKLPYLLDNYDQYAVAEARGLGISPSVSGPLSSADSAALAQERYTSRWGGRFSTPEEAYNFNQFRFDRPGQVTEGYLEREQRYWNASAQLVSQQGAHTVKVGGEYKRWTIRNYSGAIGVGSNLASTLSGFSDPGARDSAYAATQDSIAAETDALASTIRSQGVNYYGYDEFGNEVDSGPDGPKQPIEAAAFVNDKIEYEDIIVNAGLRMNYYDIDSWKPKNLKDPPYTGTNPGEGLPTSQILVGGEDGLEETSGEINILPRLGMSFPIGERTVFHLQYGKFSQMPDLNTVYAGRGDMARVFSGGNFIAEPFAWDLDPIKTTQYEIGFGYQFSDFAAFDLTAYYRRTDDQVTITDVEPASDAEFDASRYNLFTNGAFSITRGFEVSLRTKRIGGVMGMVNYSLSDAKGTNSDPSGQVAAIEAGAPTPSQIQPLEFQQRHTGSVVLDYSSGSDNPVWAQNWSANVLFRFSSGHPYTLSTGGFGQRSADDGPLLTNDDPRNRSPLTSINAATTPFTTQTDLRLSRGFDLGVAEAKAYISVENLFNQRNVVNVYRRTGSATSDGFLSNPQLSGDLVEANGQRYVDYYQAVNLDNARHYREDAGQDLFGTPREIRIGFEVTY